MLRGKAANCYSVIIQFQVKANPLDWAAGPHTCAAEMKMLADATLSGCLCPRVITYYALLMNSLLPVVNMIAPLTLRLICVYFNGPRIREPLKFAAANPAPRIARSGLSGDGPMGTDFSSFDFKILLLYRNGGIVRELI